MTGGGCIQGGWADPLPRDTWGTTGYGQQAGGMHPTGMHSCEKYADTLIQAGTDVNIQEREGCTALMRAALLGRDKCVDILIQGGADVNVQNRLGNTALMEAVREDHDKCVKTLIQRGADVNTQNRGGYTVLMLAVTEGFDKCVEILIQVGADVNLQDDDGNTALMQATKLGHDKCVKVLAEAESVLHLSHLCRASIRKHLLQMNNMNLSARVSRLGLPEPLEKYLLFTEI